MSQIKVDNVKHVVPHTQVDVVQNKKTEPDQKAKVKPINLSQHEVELLDNTRAFLTVLKISIRLKSSRLKRKFPRES